MERQTKKIDKFHKSHLDLQQQLTRKTQECGELKAENEELKKKLTITEDNFACEMQARLYHQNEWLKISEENETLKSENFTFEELVKIQEELIDKYKQVLDEIEQYTTKQFCDNCEEIGSTELTSHCEFCEYGEFLDIINKAKDGE